MIRIFLTGYMGAGKTTLGKALARELHIPFIDLDWYIESVFTKRSESCFLNGEKLVLGNLKRTCYMK